MNNYKMQFYFSANNRNGYDVRAFTGTQASAEHAALNVQRENLYAGVTVVDSSDNVIFEAWGRW